MTELFYQLLHWFDEYYGAQVVASNPDYAADAPESGIDPRIRQGFSSVLVKLAIVLSS